MTDMPVIDLARSRAVSRRVLRILSGRLEGKEFPLDGRDRLCVGHGLANDVVLRGAGTREGTIELRLMGDRATMRVIEGRAELLGRALEAGEDAQLPAYLPFCFGEYLIAHGERGSARWRDANDIARTPRGVPGEELPAPRLSDRLFDIARTGYGRIDRHTLRLALGLGCGGLLVAAAAQPVGQMMLSSRANAREMTTELRQSGFPAVSVAGDDEGSLAVKGAVSDEEELARLRALVAQRDADATVDVQTGTALAAEATDILQAQGIAARVAPSAPAALVVNAGYMPANRQDQVRALLHKDLPVVRKVAFRIDDALGANPLQAFFAQSGAGLATVVANPAHIVTADGSHWFPGATLPTGHRLVSVSAGAVVFEKDGRAEQITL
ncbi:hypothetical protein [Sphingobium aromaticiconvertens]|uniref:hypothetical protein n=1 Tax=Sphingobium aromaticiconvertens TaxID=365341 RepID=UPI003018084C